MYPLPASRFASLLSDLGSPTSDLPVREALPVLAAALAAHNRAVLVAPPGAGKTTLVPLALLDAPWRQDGRVIVLEPRRLAARAAAARMAHLIGERVGETVGYRVRMDAAVSARTRVEVVTEGILTRLLQDDPGLDGVAALLFDEFHERSLHADLGLALALDAQAALRPDLRLVVMSATLEADRLAAFLGEGTAPAPVIRSEGRAYPVETHYLSAQEAGDRAARPAERLARLVPRAILHALAHHAGDVLAFLPGLGEIRRVAERLALPPDTALHVLHGDLPLEAQDAAVRPPPPGARKVVLATSLAESSLTIEGVRVVVDGGYSRVPRFSPRTGLTTLATVPVSRQSADQRRGRAGRLGPGVCYRLWTKADHARLPEAVRPEVLEADLAPLALELTLWGVRDAAALRWLDPPPPAALETARALLAELGALDASGAPTAHGRALAALGLHPRFGHLVLEGRALGLGPTACALAALLGERDVLRAGEGPRTPDLRLRLEAVARWQGGPVRRVAEAAKALARRAGVPPGPVEAGAAGLLAALAYPDRLAHRDADTRVRLASGQRATLDADAFPGADFLAVAHLDGPPHAPRVALAAPIALEDIEAHFGTLIRTEEAVAFDEASGRVVARRRRTLGALVLGEAPLPNPDSEAVASALLEAVRSRGLTALPWSKEAERLRARLAFLHHHLGGDWPDVSDAALLETLDVWLGPHVAGMRALSDLARLDLAALLEGLVPWSQRSALDRFAPSHLTVPSGSRLPLDYTDPDAPVLAVRLQEVFGLLDTPRVLDGRVPLVLHLLSPAHRPVQVTRDLRSFWQAGYFDVRRDLRGRYPKHPWPDDPLKAEPTRRAKPR
jgi:ATP-dependent helicase HrpB